MTALYDKLGVKKTAGHAEIKRAYRKKATRAHPDKGGTESEMAELSRAWEVLGDPEKRRIYDETGREEPIHSVEDEARSALLSAFAHLVENKIENDLVGCASRLIEERLHGLEDQKSAGEDLVRKLQKQRGKVRLGRAKPKIDRTFSTWFWTRSWSA